MKKIKIIHIVESLNLGGLEKVVASICLGSDKYKYDLSVCCIACGGEIAAYLQSRGVEVKILGIRHYYNPLNIVKLMNFLKDNKPDIVQTHGYFSSVIGRSAALLAGVKVVINHVHTAFHGLKPRNVFIDRYLNKYTDAIIFVSNASKESFRKAGYSNNRSIVIHNGVDGTEYTANKNPLKEKVISIVASLRPDKGHTYLLKAMALALEDLPDLKLWIVGDGPLMKDLERETYTLGIEKNVTFWGKKDNVRDILGKTSVFVLSSLREGLPVALVEALASGLPVIAPNIGGVPEVVKDRENGFIVPESDERALSKAILDMFYNPARLEKMGQCSRELFDRFFSLEKMVNQLDVLYQNLLKKKR